MSGIEAMEAVGEGRIPAPPIAALLGIELVEAEEGRAVFAVTPDESHYNPIGAVHGGLAATLLDSAAGCAVQTTLPRGSAYTTLELKANFVRAITKDTGRIVCEGRVVHGGRTVATAEGRVVAEKDGKLLAHGTATCLVFPTNGTS
ncbi:MAG: PaaI family thioesterase [Actinobacteria bacterium]|nr:PaaI family thioesterase [Actinomycetota bacterium]